MVHETGHAYSQKLGLFNIKVDTGKLNFDLRLVAIAKLEHIYAQKNLISMSSRLSSGSYINPDDMVLGDYGLTIFHRSLIDKTYDKLLPLFNRFMFYTK